MTILNFSNHRLVIPVCIVLVATISRATPLSAQSLITVDEPLVTFIDADNGADNRIASIANLDIGGITYDVAFFHDVSYENLLAAYGEPLTFTDSSEALLAANTIVRTMNALEVDALLPLSLQLIVPYDDMSILGEVRVATSFLEGFHPLTYREAIDTSVDTNYRSPYDGYAIFYPRSIPEPSGLIALVFSGLLLIKRRR